MDSIINQVAQQSASKGATAAVDLGLEQWITSLRERAAGGVRRCASGYRLTFESQKNLRTTWDIAPFEGYQALDSFH